jgi:hypothetical protein
VFEVALQWHCAFECYFLELIEFLFEFIELALIAHLWIEESVFDYDESLHFNNVNSALVQRSLEGSLNGWHFLWISCRI